MLLAAYRPADGTEEPLAVAAEHWAPIGPAVRTWGFSSDVAELEKRAATDSTMDGEQVGGTQEEGYVIRFASGVRAKLKLTAYLALHRLYTGTNEKTVWEALAHAAASRGRCSTGSRTSSGTGWSRSPTASGPWPPGSWPGPRRNSP